MAGNDIEAAADKRPFIDQALDRFVQHPGHDHLREMLSDYSMQGQLAMTSLLYYADEDGVLDRAIEVLDETHEKHWKFQHPEMRGDPEISVANASWFGSMFTEAGIQWPRPQPDPHS